MDKRFMGILAALVVIFIGIFVFTQHSSNSGNNSTNSTKPTNHILGSGTSGVTLIEYGDYECPICELYYQPLKQLTAEFSQQIYFQFRNLPLTQIHPNAFAGARAAEAAGLQGTDKFWAMHDKLYANQNDWIPPVTNPVPIFDNYAKSIGLNVSQFDTDYASSKVNSLINADLGAFDKTGQSKSTPAFFLDGQYIDNLQLIDSSTQLPSVPKFATLINAEIAKKANSSKY